MQRAEMMALPVFATVASNGKSMPAVLSASSNPGLRAGGGSSTRDVGSSSSSSEKRAAAAASCSSSDAIIAICCREVEWR